MKKAGWFRMTVCVGLGLALITGIAQVSAEPSTNGFLFIDNGQVRLGVNTHWGCGIAWLSASGSPRNLVNHWDHGRLIQQSYYGAKDGSRWNEKPWRWNPVQGGHWQGKPATTLALRSTHDTLYAKSRGIHWASGEDLPEVTFEQWITLTGQLAHVRFRMTYTGTHTHPTTSHEIPAVFLAPDLEHLVLYDGQKPWTGDTLARSKPGWPNESRRMTEHWAAYVDAHDWGVGAYVPKADKLTCYRFGSSPTARGACSYFAPLTEFAIGPGTVFDYDVWLTIGTVEEMRARFAHVP